MTQPIQEPETDDLEDFGELEVAEYIVFLLALDTYIRYVEETHGVEAEDDLTRRGVQLVRMADRQHMQVIRSFLDGHLPSATHKRMLSRAFTTLPTHDGLGKRTFKLRTLLSLGGTATMRAVFKSNKALREIREALAAAAVDDADKALDLFEAIPLSNQRLRKWIDVAAETAGSGQVQNAVAAASGQVAEDTQRLYEATARQDASEPASDESKTAVETRKEILTGVQAKATDTAQRAMQVSGELDEPPKKSEVIGIATAAVAAAMGDPRLSANKPPSLQGLDLEQELAATTDGRVLVAAGAGSGKTTTLCSRLAYLVQERRVSPSRIFCVSFNKKAAQEIRERVAAKVGKDIQEQMSIGTMHSIFKNLVVQYGTPEEKAALTSNMIGKKRSVPQNRGQQPRVLTQGVINIAMAKMWKECTGTEPPRAPGNVIQAWIMNNVSPVQAKAQAIDGTERDQAEWYAWLQGFKGVDKTWHPPCADEDSRAEKNWTGFLAEWRSGGKDRLGDFTDMIVMCRDLLKRNPAARAKVQGMYDHVCIDEGQDLNEVQHEIIAMMSEHIGDGKDGKSLWIVGDEVQSINRFVGARPELFTQFNGKEGWTTRSIATNHRCLPEIVEFANTLMTNHPRGIPMEAKPDLEKPRGQASVVVQTPETNAGGAISVIGGIKQDLDAGAAITDYAVLSRNRVELNDYETACIIEGIPYGRKEGTSFLRSPETVTVMSYVNLAVGQDFERMQRSLVEVLDKPKRFFFPAGRAEQVVQEVVNKRARRLGLSSKQVNPLDLFDAAGVSDFMDALDPKRTMPSWKERDSLSALHDLGDNLKGLRASVEEGVLVDRTGKETRYTTNTLFGDILNIRGNEKKGDGEAYTLREVLMPQGSKDDDDDEDEDPDADTGDAPIGNVEFLYRIASPTPESPESDPSDPRKFKAKMDDLAAKSRDLRVDLDAWTKEQNLISDPNKRRAAPCVVLSTIHSVKGAQWNNTTVIMAKGVFPRDRKPNPDHDSLSPEVQERIEAKQRAEFLTERQLAYVAMTRAAKSLTIVGPMENAYGRDSGPSVFVGEAGLKVGQNVPGKNDPTPEAETTPPVRTVLAYYNGRVSGDEDSSDAYDWRQS